MAWGSVDSPTAQVLAAPNARGSRTDHGRYFGTLGSFFLAQFEIGSPSPTLVLEA